MASKNLLIAGAVIAAVAAGAILIPGIAAGVPLAGLVPASTIVTPDDWPGNSGRGNAFGHHRDSEDFPGNHGNRNGQGNGWGHDEDSPGFPGNQGRDRDNPQDDGED